MASSLDGREIIVVQCWWNLPEISPLMCQGELLTGRCLTRGILPNLLKGITGEAAGCWPPAMGKLCMTQEQVLGKDTYEHTHTHFIRTGKQNPFLLCPLLTKLNIVPIGKGKILKGPRSISQSRLGVNLKLHGYKWLTGARAPSQADSSPSPPPPHLLLGLYHVLLSLPWQCLDISTATSSSSAPHWSPASQHFTFQPSFPYF